MDLAEASMRLAGQMRLNNFLAIVGVGVFAVFGLGCGVAMFAPVACVSALPDAPAPPAPGPSPVVVAAEAPPVEVAAVPAVSRDFEKAVLDYAGKPIGGEKLQDIVPGPVKVNVYQDAGESGANRAKIDLDRDEKWDEKWTFKSGEITREVAPNDDESYSASYSWNGSGWTQTGGASAAPAIAATSPYERPVDEVVMRYRGQNIGSDKLKDVTSGTAYKVNVYQDPPSGTANRAKIDLDRDDKWDEKITYTADTVKREVAPADDENYTESYIWTGTSWTRQ
jgi:hypothetical protein